jgi:hyperosmotically inducible periplasmic protein
LVLNVRELSVDTATFVIFVESGGMMQMRILSTLTMSAVLIALPVAAQKNSAAPGTNALHGNQSQDRITREVRHELVMLPYYGVFDNLAYSVNGGVVTLYGQVTNPTLKSDAGNAVKGIEGVTRVDNKIEVLPLSPMDDQIRRAEYRAIYSEPSLSRYSLQAVPPIHVIVNNGKVTLVGVVANETDKNLAGLRANGVSGVFSVDNELKIEGR